MILKRQGWDGKCLWLIAFQQLRHTQNTLPPISLVVTFHIIWLNGHKSHHSRPTLTQYLLCFFHAGWSVRGQHAGSICLGALVTIACCSVTHSSILAIGASHICPHCANCLCLLVVTKFFLHNGHFGSPSPSQYRAHGGKTKWFMPLIIFDLHGAQMRLIPLPPSPALAQQDRIGNRTFDSKHTTHSFIVWLATDLVRQIEPPWCESSNVSCFHLQCMMQHSYYKIEVMSFDYKQLMLLMLWFKTIREELETFYLQQLYTIIIAWFIHPSLWVFVCLFEWINMYNRQGLHSICSCLFPRIFAL